MLIHENLITLIIHHKRSARLSLGKESGGIFALVLFLRSKQSYPFLFSRSRREAVFDLENLPMRLMRIFRSFLETSRIIFYYRIRRYKSNC